MAAVRTDPDQPVSTVPVKITSTSEITGDAIYYIQNVTSGTYVKLQSSYTEDNVTNATPLVSGTANATGFTLTTSGTGFTISDGTYYVGISSTDWNSSATTTAKTWYISANSDDTFYIYSGTNNYWK